MNVRDAQSGDEERILAMYEWLFEPPGYTPPAWDTDRARRALTEAILSGESVVLLAEEEGAAPLGFCTAYLELNSVRYGRRCWIEDLAVDPERRSEGIGKALLDAAKQWARERGATHLELDTGVARKDARRFYEREHPTTVGLSYSWQLDADDPG